MRLAILLMTTVAAASPPKVWRKPAAPDYPVDAVALFVDGILADQAGNLNDAERAYENANKLSPAANTYYNLADVQQRMGRLKQALESYKQYLALAPDAKDHAEVAQLVDALERSEATIVIDGEEPDAVVLVDGRLVGPSPAITHVPKGMHTAYRITQADFQHREFNAINTSTQHVEFGRASSREQAGNVVLVSNRSGIGGQWTDHGVKVTLGQRQTLPPGHYQGTLRSYQTCSPIIFDVPTGDDLTFVYVDLELPQEQPDHTACSPLVTRQLKVKLPR